MLLCVALPCRRRTCLSSHRFLTRPLNLQAHLIFILHLNTQKNYTQNYLTPRVQSAIGEIYDASKICRAYCERSRQTNRAVRHPMRANIPGTFRDAPTNDLRREGPPGRTFNIRLCYVEAIGSRPIIRNGGDTFFNLFWLREKIHGKLNMNLQTQIIWLCCV